MPLIGGDEIQVIVIIKISCRQESSLDIDGKLNRLGEEDPRHVQEDRDAPAGEDGIAEIRIPISIQVRDNKLSSIGSEHLALREIAAVEDRYIIVTGDCEIG